MGLAEAYKAAVAADIAFPITMTNKEVQAFLDRVPEGASGNFSSGIQELSSIVNAAKTTDRQIMYTQANRALLRLPDSALSHSQAVNVESLSPFDADTEVFIEALASRFPLSEGQRLMPFRQNQVSIALWITIGPHRVLLGADLENHSDPKRGWTAVLNSPAKLIGQAGIIKVPHHGSQNAHHAEVWNTLLSSQPSAALTPWNRGSKLPTHEDVARIIGLTPHAYATNRIDRKPKRRAAAVEKTIEDIRLRALPTSVGHVRLRLNVADAPGTRWTFELFGGATLLKHLAA